jgi:DNA polymerase
MSVYASNGGCPTGGPASLIDDIRRSLEHLAAAGWRGFDCAPETLARLAAWDRPLECPPGPATLEHIAADLGDCRRCKLWRGRRRIVFGAGPSRAALVLVGEGPGQEEDRQGLPFVGAAGELLTRIIAAMGLKREAVYICNVIKCRPPDNRNPEPDEIAACLPFLRRQIAAIRPRCICTLGAVAAQALLGTQAPLGQLRGRFQQYDGIALMPTYHPAYLLRYPEKKRAVWQDIQQVMAALEGAVHPGPRTPQGG